MTIVDEGQLGCFLYLPYNNLKGGQGKAKKNKTKIQKIKEKKIPLRRIIADSLANDPQILANISALLEDRNGSMWEKSTCEHY